MNASRVRAFDRWVTIHHRDRADDLAVIEEVLVGNVYRPELDHLQDKVVVDCGANIGTFSALAIACRARRLVAIEPNLENLKYLEQNMERAENDHGPVDIVFSARAIGDPTRGRVSLAGEGATGYTVPGDDIEPFDFMDVLTLAGGIIDFLKVDVEGAEYEWFATATPERLSRVNLFSIEWHGASTGGGMDGGGPIGTLVEQLLETHAPTMFGRPKDGGLLYAHAYDWPPNA